MTTSGTEAERDRLGDDLDGAHLDVLVVGAGLSGIGAACRLTRALPSTRLLVLEAREAMGGTWDLFRYPGVRSDSDMFTLGYGFRPWTRGEAIADGPAILEYVRETAAAYGITERIRYGRRVTALSWDSSSACWTAEVTHATTGEVERLTARFVYSCTGYYDYDAGYTPDFADVEQYGGTIVHPQHWPEDLDVTDRKVVVIGSGATAVTLVPALAGTAAHVTMLQRSPTWVLSVPGSDAIAAALRRWLPERLAHTLVKWKNLLFAAGLYQLSRRAPRLARRLLLRGVTARLPDGFDVATHFTPSYDPWDQRLCLVPDDDLFVALSSGRASVVTDRIGRFTPTGVALDSGTHLDADVVVTATGLNLLLFGGIQLRVDGQVVDAASTVAYKGMMLSGVPNLAFAVGYTNASWTLKVDLVSDYVCRLLAHMDAHGLDQVTPQHPGTEVPLRPLIDLDSGYIRRALDSLPRQAAVAPWQLHQSYVRDVASFRRGALEDDGVRFSRSSASPRPIGRDVTR